MILALLRDLEKFVFSPKRGALAAERLNALVGWIIDRTYQTPVLVVSALLACFFFQGFLSNSLTDQGAHPAPLMVFLERPVDETFDETRLTTAQAEPLQSKLAPPLPTGLQFTTAKVEAASSAEAKAEGLSLISRFDNDLWGTYKVKSGRNTPEETSALARAALSAARNWN